MGGNNSCILIFTLFWLAAEECVWVKILLYNPRDVSRAANLLLVSRQHY